MNSINVREAVNGDFNFVSALMHAALSPFYDGDHVAHAKRIFDTHIEGGIDHCGHFSLSQKMFVAEVDGERAGIIHIVGKKQQTCKMSPLIVAERFRNGFGVGSFLLKHAEAYARKLGARQIYCTVSKINKPALDFFIKNRFVIAGESDGHYKKGIPEVILYKNFNNPIFDESLDRINISVIPFEDKYREDSCKLIKTRLKKYFNAIDDSWIDSLFEGYKRRESGDVNKKYKLIYIAVDSRGKLLGVVAATPKKGQPIKLMPLVTVNYQAFIAILFELPFVLKGYGSKLYTHIVPSVLEISAFQKMGWTLDCIMPGAYSDKYATQQWGFNMKEDAVRPIRVKAWLLKAIKSGSKTLEVRVGYDNIKNIKTNDQLKFCTYEDSIIKKVSVVRIYKSIDEMLETEDVALIIPGFSKKQASEFLKKIYPIEKERLGIYVFEIM